MGKDHRVTLQRRHAYRTLRNRVKTIKTPGGRHTAQYISKSRRGATCGDCGISLPGVSLYIDYF
jgi:large subunit ribosomal protein L34e